MTTLQALVFIIMVILIIVVPASTYVTVHLFFGVVIIYIVSLVVINFFRNR